MPVIYARSSAPDHAPPEPFGILKLFFASPLGAIVTVLAGVSWSIVFTFGPVYAQRSGFNLYQVSLFMAVAMLGGAVIQFPMGWLSDAMGRRLSIALMSLGGVVVSLFGIWADGRGMTEKFTASALVGGLIFDVCRSRRRTRRCRRARSLVCWAELVLLFRTGLDLWSFAQRRRGLGACGASGYYVVFAATLVASLAAAAVTR